MFATTTRFVAKCRAATGGSTFVRLPATPKNVAVGRFLSSSSSSRDTGIWMKDPLLEDDPYSSLAVMGPNLKWQVVDASIAHGSSLFSEQHSKKPDDFVVRVCDLKDVKPLNYPNPSEVWKEGGYLVGPYDAYVASVADRILSSNAPSLDGVRVDDSNAYSNLCQAIGMIGIYRKPETIGDRDGQRLLEFVQKEFLSSLIDDNMDLDYMLPEDLNDCLPDLWSLAHIADQVHHHHHHSTNNNDNKDWIQDVSSYSSSKSKQNLVPIHDAALRLYEESWELRWSIKPITFGEKGYIEHMGEVYDPAHGITRSANDLFGNKIDVCLYQPCFEGYDVFKNIWKQALRFDNDHSSTASRASSYY